MKLIVGLGNPGDKYFKTRHNVGFLFLDFLKQHYEFSDFLEKRDFKSMISEGSINGEKYLLVKPTTFMNLSGDSVLSLVNYYKLTLDDVLVVFDDIDLLFGDVRYKQNGGPGTHNGMRDICTKLNSRSFSRLKFGIEIENRFHNLSDFVLSNFSKDELDSLFDLFKNGLDLIKNDFF